MKGKYSDLFEKYGMILNLKYMNNIIKDKDVLDEFTEEFKKLEQDQKQEFMKSFLEKYFKSIDTEAYVFYTLKTINEMSESYKFENIAQRCRKALKNSNFVHYEIDRNATKIGDEIQCFTAQFLISGEDKQADGPNKTRLELLERDIDLELLFDLASCTQMSNAYCKNLDLSSYITKLGLVEALGEVCPLSQKEKLELVDDYENKLKDILTENMKEINEKSSSNSFHKYIPVYLRKYPEEFNLDVMLMYAAFRINSKLEYEDMSDEDNIKYSKLLKSIKEHIQSRRTKVLIQGDEGNSIYSYATLENGCSRITDTGRYFSVVKENDLRNEMSDDGNAIRNIDADCAKVMKFRPEDYKTLIESTDGILLYLVQNDLIPKKDYNIILNITNINQNDFIQLINEGKVSKEQIKKYLERQENIGEPLFSIMYENDLVSSEEILEHYLEGKIDIKFFTKMSDKNKSEISSNLSTDRLMELYRDSEKQDEYERYANIFRNMILSGKTREEKEKISEDIIENLGLDFEDEDLVRLYQEHLISSRTVESWGGSALITDMMRNAILKPLDVKEICRDGNYDSIFEIMKDKQISRKNKLAIFYTTFADEDDTLTQSEQELRELAKEECLIYMNFYNKSIRPDSKINRENKEEKEGEQLKEKRKEYVSEPLNRWTLIRLLDEEYSYEMLNQGMMIFKLPNLEGGTVILEKMFRKEVPDYGRATKVLHMSIEEFEKIKKDLIIEGDIPVFAVDRHPKLEGKVNSLWHSTSWGQKLSDLFDYKLDKNRSKDNIEKIDKEIERIKRSRKIRE